MISIPIKAQAEIRFDFLRATDTRIVDTHKIVPIQYQDSTTRPPDNTSPLTHTDTSPRYIDARLQSAGASTSISPIVRGVYMEARTTVVIPVQNRKLWCTHFRLCVCRDKRRQHSRHRLVDSPEMPLMMPLNLPCLLRRGACERANHYSRQPV